MSVLFTLYLSYAIFSWMGVFQKQYYDPHRLKAFLKKEEVFSKKTMAQWWGMFFSFFLYVLCPLLAEIVVFLFGIFFLFCFPKEKWKLTSRSVLIFIVAVALAFLWNFLLSFCPYLHLFSTFFFSDLAIVLLMIAEYLLMPKNAILRRVRYRRTRRWFLAHPNVRVIAITGSFGKTSMKQMLTELLSSHYRVARTKGSVNTPYGICKTVQEELTGKEDFFIAECGVDAPHTMRRFLSLFRPSIIILTGLTEMHLATFHSKSAILKEKLELVCRAPVDTPVFYNGEIKEFQEALKDRSNSFPYYGDLQIEKISAHGTYFHKKGEEFTYFVSLFGKHQLCNLSGALQVASYLQVPQKEIFYRLALLKSEPHRFQVTIKHGKTMIDDTYNTNPIGLKSALETTLLWKGKKGVITAGVIEIGACNNRLLLDDLSPLFAQFDVVYVLGKKEDYPLRLIHLPQVKVVESFAKAFALMKQEQVDVLLLSSDPGRYHL